MHDELQLGDVPRGSGEWGMGNGEMGNGTFFPYTRSSYPLSFTLGNGEWGIFIKVFPPENPIPLWVGRKAGRGVTPSVNKVDEVELRHDSNIICLL